MLCFHKPLLSSGPTIQCVHSSLIDSEKHLDGDRPQRIHLLANPSTFSLNGTTIAASSVDVLFHLGKQEHFFEIPEASDEAPPSGDEVKSDPTARRCRHLLQQRSFYPIYPVPPEVSNHVNLDLTHRRALKTDDSAGVAREIFITPSQLWQFCKVRVPGFVPEYRELTSMA